MNKSLTIQTNTNNIEIDYPDKDTVRVKIHSDMELHIEMDNDVMLESHGDFTIAANGELGLISLGRPLCLDSVDSEIHMNYRQSKHLINLPESIAYRKKLDEENQKCIENNVDIIEHNSLKKELDELKYQFEILEKRVTYIAGNQ